MKWTLLLVLLALSTRCTADQYRNFDVAIYIPAGVVRGFEDPQQLQNDWNLISRQLKVDKVYIEAQRDHMTNNDALLERVKHFFIQHGVRVAGGMALSNGGNGGQFQSFCYTDPNDRAFIRGAAELAARHFDEIIQDDFFFNSTKYDSDIAAKGGKSWTRFRLQLMDDAAQNLIIKPARRVNPRVRMIIKFPNWYEHFQGNGYDLDRESKLFDGIYTGTETRDPFITDQHLQQYESYEIMRYLDNIAPGRNGGGWVDTYSIRYIDRYAEQLWDTMFAKAPQIMLFEWSAMTRPIEPGDRQAWADLHTSFDYDNMLKSYHAEDPPRLDTPTIARVAGYSLEQVDAFLAKLGNPIGIAAYKPFQSTGEDYLHNYLGMIGIPIELHPDFPTNADMVLLTESAKLDPDIVPKIKNQLRAGKSVVITSGLLRALQGHGIEDIVEAQCTGRKVMAREFSAGFGAGNASALDETTNAILLPEIDFITNDAWSLVRAEADGNAFPVLLMDRYSKGILYILTIPDNFNDLYALPNSVTRAIKTWLMRGFPVRVDGPNQVALFAYDNHTFIVESYLDAKTDVKISVPDNFKHLKNLVTGEEFDNQPVSTPIRWGRQNAFEKRNSFNLHLLPHSYEVLAMEQ